MPAMKPEPLPVLLIEDEPSVMSYVRAALERSGYRWSRANRAPKALRLLEAGEFLGVVSDMRTPGGVDGADVHAWLAANRPELAARTGFHYRRHRQRRNRRNAAPNRRALRGEAVPRCSNSFRSSKRPWGRHQ